MKHELTPCILVLFSLTAAGISLSHADSISSSIICDGAAWLSASVIGPEETYASRFFVTDLGSIVRDLTMDEGIRARTTVESAGPAGVFEYVSQNTNETKSDASCVFNGLENRTFQLDRIETLGLLGSGIYASDRELSWGRTTGTTMITGTGMILTEGRSEDQDETQESRVVVSGRMNLSDRFVFGED